MSAIKDGYIFINIPNGSAGAFVEDFIGGVGYRTLRQIIESGSDDFGNQYDHKKGTVPSVCFVRNPYDRLVSAYSFVKQTELAEVENSFADFVRNIKHWANYTTPHFWTQYRMIEHEGIEPVPDVFTYRFESFAQEFEFFKRRFGEKGQIPRIQKSVKNHWKTYYNDELKVIVDEVYEDDFRVFQYPKAIL